MGVSGYGRWHLLMTIEQMLLGRLELVGVTVINPVEQAMICRRLARLGVPVVASDLPGTAAVDRSAIGPVEGRHNSALFSRKGNHDCV